MGVGKWKRYGTSIYKTKRWEAVRKLAKDRDKWKCVKCDSRKKLQVDHIIPLRKDESLAYELTNLQTLCVVCHSKKTRIEIGLGPVDPEKEKWRNLLRDMPKM